MSGTKTAESEENGQNAEEVPEMESSPALLQQNRLNV